MSIFDGMSRPMRAAGLGLLAVAVIAATLGGVALVTGDDGSDNAASTNTAETPPDQGTGDGNPPQAPGEGSKTSPEDTKERSPGNGSDGDNGGDRGETDGNGGDGDRNAGEAVQPEGPVDARDQQVSDSDVPVRVYNNSRIRGLASEAGDDLRSVGWNVVEVGNYSAGVIPTSTVYFRPGTDEEDPAHALARHFGMRAEPRFDGIADSSPGVIVIVTKDYSGPKDGK